MKQKIKSMAPSVALVALLAVNALFFSFNAFRTFKFFDMGAHLDMSWRLACGQKPFTDFISYCGPMHFYINAFLFKCFGFGKTAIWVHLVIVSSLVILAAYILVKDSLPFAASALITLLAMTSFYWPISHPWYTHTTHLLGLLGVVIISKNIPFENARRTFWASFAVGFLAFLAIMTKINTGGLYFLLYAATFLFCPKKQSLLLGLTSGFAASAALIRIFFIPSYTAFADQVLFAWGPIASHRLDFFWKEPSVWFRNYYWLIAALSLAPVLDRVRQLGTRVVLFLGLWVVGIVSTSTSGAIFESDVQAISIYAGLGMMFLYQGNDPGVSKFRMVLNKTARALLMCLVLFLSVLYGKYGFELKGWTAPEFFTFKNRAYNPIGTYAFTNKPFKGWLCNPEQGPAVDGIVAFVDQNIPKTESLLILTDLQIVYPLTGRDSFRNIPWIFTIDQSPAPGKQLEGFQKVFFLKPPRWILTHTDRVAYITNLISYLGLTEEITRHYAIAQSFGKYVLLRRTAQ